MNRIIPLLIICLIIGSCKKDQLRSFDSDIPGCIQDKIEAFLAQPKDTRPYSITEYLYKGKLVYYIIAPCCDQYNPVYDADCEYLGAPNGGISGGGDRKLTDFFTTATLTKVIWENK